jgi:hypothetical protein
MNEYFFLPYVLSTNLDIFIVENDRLAIRKNTMEYDVKERELQRTELQLVAIATRTPLPDDDAVA